MNDRDEQASNGVPDEDDLWATLQHYERWLSSLKYARPAWPFRISRYDDQDGNASQDQHGSIAPSDEEQLGNDLREQLRETILLTLFNGHVAKVGTPFIDESQVQPKTLSEAQLACYKAVTGDTDFDKKKYLALVKHIEVGRIIVHGLIPNAEWSHRECWRPVDFYFCKSTALPTCCRSCKSPLKNEEGHIVPVSATDHDVLDFLPKHWADKIGESFAIDQPKPKCWPETIWLLANLGMRCVDKNLPKYTVDRGTCETIVDVALTQADDYWNDAIGWFEGDTPTIALRRRSFHVHSFDAGKDTLTLLCKLPAVPQAGDTYRLVPRDMLPCDEPSSFGNWTLQDLFILARQRLQDYSIYKTDMLKTQSQSQANIEESPKVKLYSSSVKFKGVEDDNIVHVCKEYLDILAGKVLSNKEYEKRKAAYVRTFGPEATDQPKVLLPIHGRFDTDRCVLLDWSKRTKGASPIPLMPAQGLLSFAGVGSAVLIYFEFTCKPNRLPKLKAQWDSFQGDAKNLRWLDVTQETEMCRVRPSRLLKYQRTYREADRRRTNHEFLARGFPDGASNPLIDWSKGTRKELDALEQKAPESLKGYARAIRKFCGAVAREEDSPLNLSLALLRDFWRYALRLGEPPLYSEYARFQQLLARRSEYRDHLVHSVQVFLLGHRILFALKKTDQRWLMKWGLTSLMHDFGLPLEKASDVITLMFQTFSGLPVEGSVPVAMLKQMLDAHEKKHKALILALMSPLLEARIGPDRHGLSRFLLCDAVYRSLASDRDHGFLSAVYLFHHLFGIHESLRWSQVGAGKIERLGHEEERDIETCLKEAFGTSKELQTLRELNGSAPKNANLVESVLLEILDAIAKHNITVKESRLLYTRPAVFKHPNEYFEMVYHKHNSELARFLVLCDTLCDWGRVVPGDELDKFERDKHVREDSGAMPESRPECTVVAIRPEDRCVKIYASYRWPLPEPFASLVEAGVKRAKPKEEISERGWCFGYVTKWVREHKDKRVGYESERRNLEPHGLCAQCPGNVRNIGDCPVFKELHRFWNELVLPRVRNPKKTDWLSRIWLEIEFYKKPVVKGFVCRQPYVRHSRAKRKGLAK